MLLYATEWLTKNHRDNHRTFQCDYVHNTNITDSSGTYMVASNDTGIFFDGTCINADVHHRLSVRRRPPLCSSLSMPVCCCNFTFRLPAGQINSFILYITTTAFINVTIYDNITFVLLLFTFLSFFSSDKWHVCFGTISSNCMRCWKVPKFWKFWYIWYSFHWVFAIILLYFHHWPLLRKTWINLHIVFSVGFIFFLITICMRCML